MMTWWIWMVLGAVILSVELFAVDAQFYLVFMGLSAALVGLAGLLGIVMPEWAQWTAFAVLSLISFFTFRKSLYLKLHGSVVGFKENLAGDTVNVDVELAPGGVTRVEHRGSKWTAKNTGAAAITAGSRAKVVQVDGLTLNIEVD